MEPSLEVAVIEAPPIVISLRHAARRVGKVDRIVADISVEINPTLKAVRVVSARGLDEGQLVSEWTRASKLG
jgi:hypothetical protein